MNAIKKEIGKIIWPKWSETRKNTLIVGIVTIILAGIFYAFDNLVLAALKSLIG